MKIQLSLFVALMLSLAAFTSCNKAPKAPFVLNGTLEAITAVVKDGKFVITGPVFAK